MVDVCFLSFSCFFLVCLFKRQGLHKRACCYSLLYACYQPSEYYFTGMTTSRDVLILRVIGFYL
ncbi:hypothetical protein GLYMA_15G170050v4 [Glycine max]|nr:hypothetical protein GLYMA_15G170050v4 [Glycine max]KAH1147579.1 hypothetical protein GYH30_042633 [Glycine max]